jgi:cytidine deaminase
LHGIYTIIPGGGRDKNGADLTTFKIIRNYDRKKTFFSKKQKGNDPMTFDELCQQAKSVLNPRRLSDIAESGGVGAALLTDSGKVYTGVCIDTSSGMGFCAEHAAAAAMVTAGENHVVKMVAVNWDGKVLPPCGRCREFISQLHQENINAEVMVSANKVVTLRDLLPYEWRSALVNSTEP